MMLHEELRKIYETYCLDESIDKIRFDPFIVEEIRNSTRQPFSPSTADCVLAGKVTDSCLTSQSRRGLTRRWWSCRPWGVCSRPTSTSSPSWRTFSRPCFVTAMRSVLLSSDAQRCHHYQSCCGFRTNRFPPTALSPLCTCVFVVYVLVTFEFICSVLLQYFRQLLRGAESPARSSRMSRSVLCQMKVVEFAWMH